MYHKKVDIPEPTSFLKRTQRPRACSNTIQMLPFSDCIGCLWHFEPLGQEVLDKQHTISRQQKTKKKKNGSIMIALTYRTVLYKNIYTCIILHHCGSSFQHCSLHSSTVNELIARGLKMGAFVTHSHGVQRQSTVTFFKKKKKQRKRYALEYHCDHQP